MTVGQALERAEELRPGCKVDSCTRQRWLCEEDGMLRALLFSGCGLRAGVGADLAWPAEGGLDDAVELLVPVPFDALYPHYLCAKLDAALGETERYAGEQARYNSILAELSAWLRRRANDHCINAAPAAITQNIAHIRKNRIADIAREIIHHEAADSQGLFRVFP